jgi:hypothetical protein
MHGQDNDAITFRVLQPVEELYARNFSLIYTTDPNMATHKGEDKMPVQVKYLTTAPSLQSLESAFLPYARVYCCT